MAQEAKEDSEAQIKLMYPKPEVIEPTAKHTATILWLHGLGDTGKGWLSTMQQISKQFPFVKFILPTAPKRSITCNGGHVMPGWYDIEDLQQRELNTYDGKHESAEYIHSLIEQEITGNKIPSNRLLLGGFSQFKYLFSFYKIYTSLRRCS